MPSNIFPNPSSSELSSSRSESNNRGGVAVLALLAVAARLLISGRSPGIIAEADEGAGDEPGVALLDDLSLTSPREKVRAEFRRNPGRAEGGGGTGISL